MSWCWWLIVYLQIKVSQRWYPRDILRKNISRAEEKRMGVELVATIRKTTDRCASVQVTLFYPPSASVGSVEGSIYINCTASSCLLPLNAASEWALSDWWRVVRNWWNLVTDLEVVGVSVFFLVLMLFIELHSLIQIVLRAVSESHDV